MTTRSPDPIGHVVTHSLRLPRGLVATRGTDTSRHSFGANCRHFGAPASHATYDALWLWMLSEETYRGAYGRFLAKLRQARRDASLTQVEASRRLGKPQSFVSKIESGERRVDVVELSVIAGLYGKPLSYFQEEPLASDPPA